MRGGPVFVRDRQAWQHVEAFVVCAVVTILITRTFLSATGFPKIGSGGLHIAHMLWGGLLLLVAQLLTLSYLGPFTKPLAAVLGGVGFGLFIDEVGKFVTADNNYFYRPAVAIMYVVFVVIVLAGRLLHDRRSRGPAEQLANAAAIAAEGAAVGLSKSRRAVANRLLVLAAKGGADEGLTSALSTVVAACPDRRTGPPVFHTLRHRLMALLPQNWILVWLTNILLIGQAATAVVDSLLAIPDQPSGPGMFSGIGQLTGGIVAGLIAVAALIVQWSGDRALVLQLTRYSALVTVLFTQIFDLARQEFAGLAGVAVGLFALAVVALHERRSNRPLMAKA
ncbi:hypothetical protein [Kutzneria sp. NPDC052558]|uniref:hypothetical protein n=1 Tax=Kutzneria sp. NPDC052558 TaxID=3364121 RepID=UPI0037C56B23